MMSMRGAGIAGVIAMTIVVAGCASWDSMDRTEGTAVGGAGGAVAGAVVAGPVGAVVGGVGGAYVGHETTGKATTRTPTTMASNAYDPSVIRSVQQALNDRGYDAGAADGRWGPATQDALRRFQQASGLPQTGAPEPGTLAALGVTSRDDAARTQ